MLKEMIWAHGIALHHETETKHQETLLKSGKFKVAHQHSRPAP